MTRLGRIRFSVLLFILLSAAAAASEQPGAPEAPWHKSAKGLDAQLQLTGKPEEFVRAWRGGADYRTLLLGASDAVEPGAHVATVLMLSGCHPGPRGCDVLVDYQLIGPHGAATDAIRGQHAWQGATRPGMVHLSQAMVRFAIPPKGPSGEYRVVATVREPSTGIVLELRRTFRIVAHR